jgi:hypothetical protein
VKKNQLEQPNRRHVTVLRQLCQCIPNHLVPKLARETGVDEKERSFSSWSHVLAMLYAQVSHALSLNDVCDALRLHTTALFAIRSATPPARNTLSHANKVRSCALIEQLFWSVLRQLQSGFPGFAQGRRKLWRFRQAISVVDSTTIQLVASCLDWAKHRRRKAAAKCHLRMDLTSFLPHFAIVDTAGEHDNLRAAEMCAGLCEGEIVIFDKAYVDFSHLWSLTMRGVFFVTRAKDNLACRVKKRLPPSSDPRILKDELVVLTTFYAHQDYPQPLRRVTALVEVDGQQREMVFLTNNLAWAPSSVCDLYQCRWAIETLFKELKQTMQLADFLGHSANAVKWQVWSALLVHLLLRFQAWRSRWTHSFTRLVTYVRAALWLERDLFQLLKRCGTADGDFRCLGQPEQAWLPGFARNPVGQPA